MQNTTLVTSVEILISLKEDTKGSVLKKVENSVGKIPKRQESRFSKEPPVCTTLEHLSWYTPPIIQSEKQPSDSASLIPVRRPDKRHRLSATSFMSFKRVRQAASRCNYARRGTACLSDALDHMGARKSAYSSCSQDGVRLQNKKREESFFISSSVKTSFVHIRISLS